MILFNNKTTPIKKVSYVSSIGDDIMSKETYYNTQIEIDNDYMTIMREFLAYDYIKENNLYSSEIVQESFSDICDTIARWAQKVRDFIVNAFKGIFKFITSLFTSTDEFFKKYANEIDVKGDVDVELFDYKFDLIEKAPNTSFINDLVMSFNSKISSISDVKLLDLTEEYQDKSSDSSIADMRGKISGLGGRIDGHDLKTKVHEVFRGGTDSAPTIKLTNDLAKKILSDYSNIKNLLTNAKKDQITLIDTMDKMKEFFKNSAKKYAVGNGATKYAGHRIDVDENNKFSRDKEETQLGGSENKKSIEKIYNMHYHLTKEYSDITTMILTEKVNVIKEILTKYKEIGKKAIVSSKPSKDKEEGDK